MKQTIGSRAWRAVDAPRRRSTSRRGGVRGGLTGAWSALVFNVCLVVLAAAAASAFFVIDRDSLYAYAYSDAAARTVRQRIERLSSGLILVEFDRRRQWDDLVAMELMKNDIAAARGFLLSGRTMLPSRDADELMRHARGRTGDAELELAGLELLTPGTRARYESTVPLLSRRSASGVPTRRDGDAVAPLGAPRDFELLAGPMITGADADPMRFVLTGFGLGLSGEFTPRMIAGASALIAASRREDYPHQFGDDIRDLINAAVPAAAFRAEAAQRTARNGDPSSYPIAAPAFRAAVDPGRAAAAKAALDQIGEISEAATSSGATVLITHARSIQDLPRLVLVARAAGDRAAAAAKNLPRDGRLPRAAEGTLTFNRDLIATLIAAALAMLAIAIGAFSAAYATARRAIGRIRDVDGDHELVKFNTLKPL